jgi:hypothetical protein
MPEPQTEREQGAVEQFGELQIDFLLPAQHNGELDTEIYLDLLKLYST